MKTESFRSQLLHPRRYFKVLSIHLDPTTKNYIFNWNNEEENHLELKDASIKENETRNHEAALETNITAERIEKNSKPSLTLENNLLNDQIENNSKDLSSSCVWIIIGGLWKSNALDIMELIYWNNKDSDNNIKLSNESKVSKDFNEENTKDSNEVDFEARNSHNNFNEENILKWDGNDPSIAFDLQDDDFFDTIDISFEMSQEIHYNSDSDDSFELPPEVLSENQFDFNINDFENIDESNNILDTFENDLKPSQFEIIKNMNEDTTQDKDLFLVRKHTYRRVTSKIYHHSIVKYKHSLLFIGGFTFSKYRQRVQENVQEYNLISGKWRIWPKRVTKEVPRVVGHTTNLVSLSILNPENEVYKKDYVALFGGSNGRGKVFNDLWLLEIDKRSWKKIQCFEKPLARWLHSSVIHSDYLWIFGGEHYIEKDNEGLNSENISENEKKEYRKKLILNDLWKLSLETLQWTLIRNDILSPSKSLIPNDQSLFNSNIITLNTHFWPSPRHSHASCKFQGKCKDGTLLPPSMIVFGGYLGMDHESGIPYSNELLRFDFQSESWHNIQWKSKSPNPRSSHELIVEGNSIFSFGGFDGQNDLKSIIRIEFLNQNEATFYKLSNVKIRIGLEKDDKVIIPIRSSPKENTSKEKTASTNINKNNNSIIPSNKTLSIIELRNNNSKLESEIHYLRELLNEKEMQLKILEDNSLNLQIQKDQILSQFDLLDKQYNIKKKELKSKNELEIDYLERIRKLDLTLSQFKEKYEYLEDKYTELLKSNDEKDEELGQLYTKLRHFQAKHFELTQIIEQQKLDLDHLRSLIKDQDDIENSKPNNLPIESDLDKNNNELKETINSLNDKILFLESENKEYKNRILIRDEEIFEMTNRFEKEKSKQEESYQLYKEKSHVEDKLKLLQQELDSYIKLSNTQKEKLKKMKDKYKLEKRKRKESTQSLEEEIITNKSHISMLVEILLKSRDLPSDTKAGLFKQLQTWKVDGNLLKEIEYLGSGSFGAVFRGLYNNKEVAIKIIKGDNMGIGSNQLQDKVLKEVLIMRSVNHPNILSSFGCCFENRNAKIVLEYCQYNLSELLQNEISSIDKLNLIIQLARGLSVLHSHKIQHRDLKPQNILIQQINNNYLLKICDFGESVMRTMARTFVGTIGYSAPEVYLQLPYDHRVDIYSFGILCWEIWVRENPYSSFLLENESIRNLEQLFRMIVEKEVRPNINDSRLKDMPPQLINLMQACWHPDSFQRPKDMQDVVDILEQLIEINDNNIDSDFEQL